MIVQRYSDERMDVRTQGLNILLKSLDTNCVQMDRQGTPIKVFTNASMIGFLRVMLELMVSLHTIHITLTNLFHDQKNFNCSCTSFW